MLFHVTFEVYEDIVLPEAKSLRNEWLGPQMQKIMESGKVRESGLLSSKRGGFLWWTSMHLRSCTNCLGRSFTTLAGLTPNP
jgi:hypothetical protein